MKKILSLLLSVSIMFSLFAPVQSSAVIPDRFQLLEVVKAKTAPDVFDGEIDVGYSKIFDLSGSECWYINQNGEYIRNNNAPVDGNSEDNRYDKAAHPYRTQSDWYNTNIKGYATWDADYLYFAMVITTPKTLIDNVSDGLMWAGDCIQFELYNSKKGASTQYAFGRKDGELIAWRYKDGGLSVFQKRNAYGWNTAGTVMKVPEGGVYDKGKNGNKNVYVYELKMEWSAFGISPEANMYLPFDVSVNMNDEERLPAAFCGIQVGEGIFNGNKEIEYSPRLLLAETHTHDVYERTIKDATYTEPEIFEEYCASCGEVLGTKTGTVREDAITSIVSYLTDYFGDFLRDPVRDGKTVTELLTEKIAEYRKSQGTMEKSEISDIWNEWYRGDYDKDIFVHSLNFDWYSPYYMASFGFDTGTTRPFALKTINKIVETEPSLYKGTAPMGYETEFADYTDGMDYVSATAEEAYGYYCGYLNFLAENCKLRTYAELETRLSEAEILSKNESGSSQLLVDLIAKIAAIKSELISKDTDGNLILPVSGFCIGVLDETEVVTDFERVNLRFATLEGELTAVMQAYAETAVIEKSGIVVEDNGDIRYYEYGIPVGKGLVHDGDKYYFISSALTAVKDCWYAFDAFSSNGLLPAGKYRFGADGVLEEKNGLITEDGDIRYYENNVAVAKGLVKDADGNLYFINGAKKAVKNCYYSFGETLSNGLLPAGKYFFGADGKLQLENGLVEDVDGNIRYYENGVPAVKGLIEDGGDYYFINSEKKAVRNCWYAFGDEMSNGLLPAGKYHFNEDGILEMNDGIVKNDDVFYYENNVPVSKGLVSDADGNLYFINGTKKAVKNCWYAFSDELSNGLAPAGIYYFDENGVYTGKIPSETLVTDAEISALYAEIPRNLNEYFTPETAEAVTFAKNAIESSRDGMTVSEFWKAADKLRTALSALEYKKSDTLQIFISSAENGDIPQDYVDCTVAVVPSDKNETPFLYDTSSRVKVRGNSTANAQKKPYNIKFSSKQDLCGMGKSKKWALVANAFDKALIRNKIALDLGLDAGLSFTSSSVFADVWVDGEFKGNFLLVENVEIAKSRVNIDDEAGDVLLELEATRLDARVQYVETRKYGVRLAIDDPETADSYFVFTKLNAFELALASGDWNRVQSVANVESFVNFFIVSEFVKQVDFNFSSTRFYIKDGILYAGPGWDYDLSMGNVGARIYPEYKLYNNYEDGTGSGNSWEGIWTTRQKWFEVLLTYPEFRAAVAARFEELSPILYNSFGENELGKSKIDLLLEEYGTSFDRNYETWSITEDDVSDSLAVARTPDGTFEENVEYLRTWLEKRFEYLSGVFSEY